MRSDAQTTMVAREAARVRVRTVTGLAVAVGIALTAAFTALAQGSSHLRRASDAREQTHGVAPGRGPVDAPAPPLVSAGSSASTPSAPPAGSPTVSAAPSYPPVTVSGGS